MSGENNGGSAENGNIFEGNAGSGIANGRTQGQYAQRRRTMADTAPRDAEVRTEADAGAVNPSARPAEAAQAPRDDYGYFEGMGSGRRRTLSEQEVGEFDIPSHLIKPGWDAQWIPIRVFNEPVDPSNLVKARDARWFPARARDFPDLVTDDAPPDGPVERLGQRLFIRPAHLSHEAKIEQYNKANEALSAKQKASLSGQTLRGDDGPGIGQMDPRYVKSVPLGLTIEGEVGSYNRGS